jgi:hypothetical protein
VKAWLSGPIGLAQVVPAELNIVKVKGDGALHDGRWHTTPGSGERAAHEPRCGQGADSHRPL